MYLDIGKKSVEALYPQIKMRKMKAYNVWTVATAHHIFESFLTFSWINGNVT